MLVIKQFPVHRCGHEKNPIAANDCLLSLMRSSRNEHYFLATQDQDLTINVRKLAYVPLIYLKMNTIIMEKPQNLAVSMANKSQESSLSIDKHQFKTLKKLKTIEFGEQDQVKKKRTKKGPKGPNPLSCKKKKKSETAKKAESSAETSTSKKRKRAKRIPNHIKRMFSKIENELNQTSKS